MLLSRGEWKKADEETAELMLKAARREDERWLDVKSIERFPCADLRTLDGLWRRYSGDRFGFGVQKQIYRDCGAELDGKYPGYPIWSTFLERTGATGSQFPMWPEETDESALRFPRSVPRGHLPCTALDCCSDEIWAWWVCNPMGAIALFSRADACGL